MSWFRRSPEAPVDQPDAAASRSYRLGEIEIGSPWARASSLSGRQDGAGFFTLTNKGAVQDRLIAASLK